MLLVDLPIFFYTYSLSTTDPKHFFLMDTMGVRMASDSTVVTNMTGR
jgi:hypothetical protein